MDENGNCVSAAELSLGAKSLKLQLLSHNSPQSQQLSDSPGLQQEVKGWNREMGDYKKKKKKGIQRVREVVEDMKMLRKEEQFFISDENISNEIWNVGIFDGCTTGDKNILFCVCFCQKSVAVSRWVQPYSGCHGVEVEHGCGDTLIFMRYV